MKVSCRMLSNKLNTLSKVRYGQSCLQSTFFLQLKFCDNYLSISSGIVENKVKFKLVFWLVLAESQIWKPRGKIFRKPEKKKIYAVFIIPGRNW